MPVLDQRSEPAEAELRAEDPDPGEDRTADSIRQASFPGADPGDGDTWEIYRLRCTECDRPIALFGDEERLPQHALLRTSWNPFTSVVCPGSGQLADDASEFDEDPDFGAEPDLEALLVLPPELDWRTQPFSHVGGPGSRPVRAHVPRTRAPRDPHMPGRGR